MDTPPQAVTGNAVEKEIDGLIYGTRHMPPEDVIRNAGKIMALLGGSVPTSSAEGAKMLSGMAHIEAAMKLIEEMFELANVNGKELRKFWKIHFLGKQKAMVQVIAWLWGVHYSDFFVESKNVVNETFKSLTGGEQSPESETTTPVS